MSCIHPIVHLNGSGLENLLDQRARQYRAIEHLIQVLQKSCPHQRDFYVEAGAWEAAEAEHCKRLMILGELKAAIEIEIIRLHQHQ